MREIDPHGELELFERDYRSGKNRPALTNAIAFCWLNGLPLPQWIYHELALLTGKARAGDFASWDDALGKPFHSQDPVVGESPRERAAVRRLWMERIAYGAVEKLRKEGRPIDNELFAAAAAAAVPRVGGRGTVQKLFVSYREKLRKWTDRMKAEGHIKR